MSILQADLPQHPCYGITSHGNEYLEFACVYGVEGFYAR